MRGARFLLTVVAALAAAGCMRHEPDDVAGRGLFNSQPQVASPQYGASGPYMAAPDSYASASPFAQPYTLDAGDKLRIVVFGQDGISNAYIVDAGGT